MINPGIGPKKSQFRLNSNDVLNGNNFEQYVEKYGLDRAKGFLDATNLINDYLKEIMGNLESSGAPIFSVNNIKTNSHILYKILNNFICDYSSNGELDLKPSLK